MGESEDETLPKRMVCVDGQAPLLVAAVANLKLEVFLDTEDTQLQGFFLVPVVVVAGPVVFPDIRCVLCLAPFHVAIGTLAVGPDFQSAYAYAPLLVPNPAT